MSNGIDIPIDELVTVFGTDLWSGNNNSFYGRVFRNERFDNSGYRLSPELWITPDQYKEVLKDIQYDAQCFFDVQPNIRLEADNHIAEVWICFMVNLYALYPALTRTEATEQVHFDTRKIIMPSEFRIMELVTGFEGFKNYDWSSDRQPLVDMSPHYLFKYVTEIEYLITNC